MKKIKSLLLILLFMPVSFVLANEPVVPLVNGSVLFSDTIKTSLKKEQIKERLQKWGEENIPSNDERLITGYVNDSTNNIMSYVILEYMEMEKTNWAVHFIYIKYHLTHKYNDGYCITTLGRIGYADSISNVDDLMSAKYVLIDKKYKRTSFRDASKKITEHTVNKVFNIFESLRKSLE